MADRDPTKTVWRKSVRSAQGNCVEVAVNRADVLVRDSKDPGGPVLSICRECWPSFLRFVQLGRR